VCSGAAGLTGGVSVALAVAGGTGGGQQKHTHHCVVRGGAAVRRPPAWSSLGDDKSMLRGLTRAEAVRARSSLCATETLFNRGFTDVRWLQGGLNTVGACRASLPPSVCRVEGHEQPPHG
jgi:hypothetical protein